MRITKSTAFAVGLAVFMAGAAAAGDITISSDKLEIKGDLRLRQESKTEDTGLASTTKTNNRQRFRLRLGMNYTVDPKWSVKTQFASGTGEQTSTNQTLGNDSAQKQFWVDQAFLEFTPINQLKMYGGRMKNNMWQMYSSDIVWDSDYNPEGLAESLKIPFMNSRVFVNALQASINEDLAGSGASKKPQYLFSNQVGITVPTPMDSRVTLAGAIHDWVNERGVQISTTPGKAAGTNTGTTSTGGLLTNDFRVMELAGEFFTTLPALDLPLSLQGTYIKNTAFRDEITPKDDTGYQLGGILGKAEKKNKWEVAFFRKSSGKDSTVADIADSDFPGTNRVGNIYWLAYGVTDAAQLKAKYFDTKAINGAMKDIQLLQVDFQVKF